MKTRKVTTDSHTVEMALRRLRASIPHLAAAAKLLNETPGVGGGVGCADIGNGRVSGPGQSRAALEAATASIHALVKWSRAQ